MNDPFDVAEPVAGGPTELAPAVRAVSRAVLPRGVNSNGPTEVPRDPAALIGMVASILAGELLVHPIARVATRPSPV